MVTDHLDGQGGDRMRFIHTLHFTMWEHANKGPRHVCYNFLLLCVTHPAEHIICIIFGPPASVKVYSTLKRLGI